jgi:hypothetical protein
MICPFCKFERTHEHENPKWECPKCLKAYGKFNSNTFKENNKKTVKKDDDSEFKDWGAIILLIFVPVMVLWNFIVYGAVEICHHGNCRAVEFDFSSFDFWFQVVFAALCLFSGIVLLLKKVFSNS